MTIDLKNRIIVIGPYVRAGSVTICRLWRWDYIRAGCKRIIVKHASIHLED